MYMYKIVDFFPHVQKPVLNTTKSKRLRSKKLRPLIGDVIELLTEEVSATEETDNGIVDRFIHKHAQIVFRL